MPSKIVSDYQEPSASGRYLSRCEPTKSGCLDRVASHLIRRCDEGAHGTKSARLAVCRLQLGSVLVSGKHKPAPMVSIRNEKACSLYDSSDEWLGHLKPNEIDGDARAGSAATLPTFTVTWQAPRSSRTCRI